VKFFLNSEAANWCKAAPRSLALLGEVSPSFGGLVTHGIKSEVPSSYTVVIQLLNRLLTVPTEGGFEGGLVWQLNWWSEKESEQVALNIINRVRQGYGESRSLEDSPAYLFESCELCDAITFLIHPLLNAWAAQFVAANGQYFLTATVSGYLYFVARDNKIVERVLENTAGWKPRREIPGRLKQDNSIVSASPD
jgi:hypothetical protein